MSLEQSVRVVTHPITSASEPAVAGLLEVVGEASGSVSLVTVGLPDDSTVWEKYEVIDVGGDRGDMGLLRSALWFVIHQVRMCRAIARGDEELALFFGATSYLLPIAFTRLIGRSVVVVPRGNVPNSLYRIWSDRFPIPVAYLLSRPIWFLERIGYRFAHTILTLSPSMSEDLGLAGYGAKLYECGTRPVDVARFHPETQYTDRDLRIGYLGRLDEEKGVDTLVEVVDHLPDEIQFTFIGDGSLRNLIEDELGDAIDRGSVEVTGWVDHEDVPTRLNELRLLVMTSKTEGVPTTVLESMACGTPVAATPVGGIPDVVEDGKTGIHIRSDDPSTIADRIETTLMEGDLAGMSETARRFVVDNYSFDVVVEKYERVLTETIERSR